MNGSPDLTVELLFLGLLGLGMWAMHRPRGPLVWRELRFPTEVRAEDVEAVLARIASGRHAVVFALDGTAETMRFRVGIEPQALSVFVGTLGAIIPELRIDETEAPAAVGSSGLRAWWPSPAVLRDRRVESTAAGLLGGLSALRGDEQVSIAVRVEPVRRPPATPSPTPDVERKFAGPLLRTEVLVATRVASESRARELQRSVADSLRVLGGVRVRRLGPASVVRSDRRLKQARGWRLAPSSLLGPGEAAGVIGWPVGTPQVAGISYGTAPRLAAPRELRQAKGRVVALANGPGSEGRALKQPLPSL